jgi:superfamily II DNA or RNA helicase
MIKSHNYDDQSKIESKLLSYQIPHLYQLYESFQVNKCVLDASDTGTGKTYVALSLCSKLGLKPFIICPKSVIFSWMNVAKQLNVEIFGTSNYESLINSKYYTPKMEKVTCPYMDKENKDFIFHLPLFKS